MDQHLKTQQHLNNLRAFQDYERRLRAAYARATSPARPHKAASKRSGPDLCR